MYLPDCACQTIIFPTKQEYTGARKSGTEANRVASPSILARGVNQ